MKGEPFPDLASLLAHWEERHQERMRVARDVYWAMSALENQKKGKMMGGGPDVCPDMFALFL